MPPPFKKMTVAEVENQIVTFRFTRTVKFIDTHHTFRPNKAQYRGEATINAIHAFHTRPVSQGGAGFADIGEHWTIGPEGAVWSGRDLDRAPCSQTGFNANALMYEMIGDFDGPEVPGQHDTLDGAQLDAAVAISAAVLARFELPVSGIRFHRHLHLPDKPPPKTCPGTSVKESVFVPLVVERCRTRWNYEPEGTTIGVAALFDANDREHSHVGSGFA